MYKKKNPNHRDSQKYVIIENLKGEKILSLYTKNEISKKISN
jgi:hypothetical protein